MTDTSFNSEDAFKDLNIYGGMQYQIGYVIDELSSVIEYLEYADNGVKDSYLIDDETVDNKEINLLKEKLINHKTYLETTCSKAVEERKKELVDTIEENGIEIVWG